MKMGDSFKTRIELFFIILFIIIIAVFSVLYYEKANSTIMDITRDKLIETAISSHYLIDGDKHKTIKSINDPYYIQTNQFLAQYRKELNVADIYTLIRSGNTTKMVLASYDPDLSFMQDYILTPYIRDAFNGEFTVTPKPYKDTFGTWYTAYGPVYDSTGNVVAVVAVDIREEYVRNLQKSVLINTSIIAFIALLIAVWGSTIIGKVLENNLRKFQNRIYEIEKGNLASFNPEEFDIKEFRELAEHFESMNDRLRDLVKRIKDTSYLIHEKSGEINSIIEKSSTSTELLISLVKKLGTHIEDNYKITAANLSILETINDELLDIEEGLENENITLTQLLPAVSNICHQCENILDSWGKQLQIYEQHEFGDRTVISMLNSEIKAFNDIYDCLSEIQVLIKALAEGLDNFNC